MSAVACRLPGGKGDREAVPRFVIQMVGMGLFSSFVEPLLRHLGRRAGRSEEAQIPSEEILELIEEQQRLAGAAMRLPRRSERRRSCQSADSPSSSALPAACRGIPSIFATRRANCVLPVPVGPWSKMLMPRAPLLVAAWNRSGTCSRPRARDRPRWARPRARRCPAPRGAACASRRAGCGRSSGPRRKTARPRARVRC
jgi:hypothetical protein